MNINIRQSLELKNKKDDLVLNGLAFLAIFALSFIAGSFFLIPFDSQAVTGLALVSPNASLTASVTPGALSTDITPTASGTIVSTQQTINTKTDMPTGYNLSLEQTNTSANAAAALKPTTGTLAAPIALSNNTWGFAIPGVSSSTTSNNVVNGFDSTYTTPSPSTSSKWANPATQNTIKDRRAVTDTTGDATTVYYAAKADLSADPNSTNSFTMRYTATTNISLLPTPTISSITVSSGSTLGTNTGSTAGGSPIEIVGTGFTANDASITYSVKLGSDNCLNVTISSNIPTTGQDTIYCTTPVHPTAEAITVTVDTWGGTVDKVNGFTYIAPTPTVTTPASGAILSAGTTAQAITVTTDIPGICYYGTVASPTTSMSTTNASAHSQNITGLTNESTHTYYIRCQAASGHSYSNDKSVTFYVRKATPILSNITPANGTILSAGSTGQTISVNTDIPSTCFYDNSAGGYVQLSNTGGTSHSHYISDLTNASTNNWGINCVAGSGNTVSDWATTGWKTFYVRTAPPTVSNLAPANGTILAAGTTGQTISVNTNVAATCHYIAADWAYTELMSTTGGTSHSHYISGLTNASINYFGIGCSAGSGNTISDWGYASDNWSTFYVRAAVPVMSYLAPANGTILSAGTTGQTVTLNTNIAATCTLMGSDGWYAMSSTGGTSHSHYISGLTNASTITWYVLCHAGSGNTASDSHHWDYVASSTFYVRTATPDYPSVSPAVGATVANGTTTIYVSSSGAACYWWEGGGNWNGSGAQRTTTEGTNTLYYACYAGSDNTISDARTGSWSYTGVTPIVQTGDHIQTVTTANCPTTATRVNDARDDKSYWVKKIGTQCWMLTNLAYYGGGTNTYGDTKVITNTESMSYDAAYLMVPYNGVNATTGTTNPSTSTSGTGQYGYLYNFCAANGGQTGNGACSSMSSTAVNASISVCPRGWRLPTGNGGDFATLNTNANSGSTKSDSGLRTNWYAMYGGWWYGSFSQQGENGGYWSSTQYGNEYSYMFSFGDTSVSSSSVSGKRDGRSVRCVTI